jgi:type IX secretion system substrate protein
MKKIIASLLIAMLATTVAFAADFAPTLLTLTYEDIIQYEFDGSTLDIPVTVNGQPAGIIFSVFTKDMAEDIAMTTNGYLGWHTVNKVDTCVYYSDINTVQVGATNITWDGKDQDGGAVAAGTYTYYLWAFDNQGAKQIMGRTLHSGWGFDYTTNVQEVDENGLPMANPIWYRPANRWIIGSDPEDDTQLVATTITLAEEWGMRADPILQADDFNYEYLSVGNSVAKLGSLQKIKFVAGGDAEIVEDWGEEAPYAYIYSTAGGGSPGVATDGTYLFTGDENHTTNNDPDADFYIYDMDGYLVEEVDISPWWSSAEDFEAGAQMNGGPNNFEGRNGYVFLNCHCNCLNQMLAPSRYLDSGEFDDLLVWSNDNGDYVLDHNFEETAEKRWVCNDYNVGPYKYCVSSDGENFVAVNAYDAGAVSFGLMAPDGTGLGYLSFAGETAGWKKGEIFIDSGTPFDGMYTDNEQTMGPHYDQCADNKVVGIFFVGHDVVKGVITNQVAVEDAAPAAFAVDQNSPNPFNPTTTINFSLAQAGDVSVDVFNVAGQKVDTLANGFTAAGSHSVVWDASDFSAGVYFYTVKSGAMSKTMKMTLIK